ncbi:MAG: porin family protein [Acidobacteriota bacterium]
MTLPLYPRLPLFLSLGLLMAAAPLSAVEVTPFLGYRFGAVETAPAEVCIAAPDSGCPSAEGDDDASFGVGVTIPLNPRWAIDIHLSRHGSDLEFSGFSCPECLTIEPEGRLEQTTLLVGIERRFDRRGRIEPYLGGGLGVSRLETDDNPFLIVAPVDEDRPTLSLAGGLRVALNERLNLRLEARGFFTDLPAEVAVDDLTQVELSTGLGFRF